MPLGKWSKAVCSYSWLPSGVPGVSRESFSGTLFGGWLGCGRQVHPSRDWKCLWGWWEFWLTSSLQSDNVNEYGKIVLFALAAVSLFSRNGAVYNEARARCTWIVDENWLLVGVFFPQRWESCDWKTIWIVMGALTKASPTGRVVVHIEITA